MEYDWWRKFGAPRPCGPDAASHNEANENTAMKRISQHLPPPIRLTSRAAALSIAAFAAMVADAAPRVPYANDFSTRTSGATPSDRWMESAYIPGALARPVSSAGDAYNIPTAYQDGWTMKAGLARTTVSFTVVDDGGNQAALANPTSSSYITDGTVAMQPFYNEFTDGVLKISADIRIPAATAFDPSAVMHTYLVPVYKSGMDIEASGLSGKYPMRMGVTHQSDGNQFNLRAAAHVGNGSGGSTYLGRTDSQNAIESGRWVRYEAILDLSACTCTATFGDLSTAHPTSDDMPSSTVDFRTWVSGTETTTLPFVTPTSAETGGVAGLGLYISGFKQAAAADAPMFDNIAVSWKAPGAADFAPVYENDFSMRRYRQVEPVGATSGTYALAPTTNTVQSAFYGRATVDGVHAVNDSDSRKLVPNYESGGPYVGQDGWRRLGGKLYFTLVDPNASTTYGWENATVLRATSSADKGSADTARGCIAAPLGTSLTSGKVRLYFDIMTPSRWYYPSDLSQNFCGVYLGAAGDAEPTANAALNTVLDGRGAFGGGIHCNDTANNPSSTFRWIYTASSTFMGGQKRDYPSNPIYCRWYRFKATADLDAKTYEMEAYFIGATGRVMSATSMLSEDNLRCRHANGSFHGNAPAAIDTVFIALQSAAKYTKTATRTGESVNYASYPLFDNIRVCRVNEDGTDGAEIYSCTFEYGYRTAVRGAAALAASTDRDGADRWIRRGNASGQIDVIDAGNGDGVVSIDGLGWVSANKAAFAVQPFGSATKNCASVDFAADIRPPAFFSAENSTATTSSGYAYVEVGGDDYAQGVYRPASGNNWRNNAPRIGFGFTAASGKDACQQFTNVVFSVQTRNAATATTSTQNSDAALDTSHWYRFRVKAQPTNAGGTFTVKVYDQGTAKPAAADADGTLVATFANLALPAFGANGMTTFGLAASNFSGTRGGGLDDPNVALVDNLKVDFVPAAMVITIR